MSAKIKCWCGEENPYFAPITRTCGGITNGEVECFGCEDCDEQEGEYFDCHEND